MPVQSDVAHEQSTLGRSAALNFRPVQELQSMELGTLEEIYRMIITPLCHLNILPNEVVADWCNERLIQHEVSLSWRDTFRGYLELIDMVHWREAQDRFANPAAAILVEVLLRLTEDPKPFRLADRKHHWRFKNQLKTFIRHEHLLQAMLSLKDVLAKRWGLPKYGRSKLTLGKIGIENLLVEVRFRNHPLEEYCHSDDILREYNFGFPNNTNVFGWNKDYWMIFNDTYKFPDKGPFYNYETLDVAGQSVLHHLAGGGYPILCLALFEYGIADA